MGCFHPEKKPEENEILSFFHKMERENKFNFNIEKYEENYEIIINLSSNTFKKLKKKQQVRIGFVREIIKSINKIFEEEKEEKITKKILFYILILTLTLDNYLKERKESNISNNDLQQFLLTIVIRILNKQFINYDNMKLVLYYLANMLVILFSEIKDINHYFNIENYINLVNKTIIQKDNLKNNEIYPFIKVNLECLGICFLTNYPEITLTKKSVKILIEYYVKVYFFNYNFLLDNFAVFNKYLFLYNINNNTNKTVNNNNYYNNTKFAITDLIMKNNNFLSISNIKNIPNTNDVSNFSINQSRIMNNNIFKNSYISNIDEFSYNNNEFIDLIKTKEFKDIQKITISLYSFLKTTIQDTLSGQKTFKQVNDTIDDEIKRYNNLKIKSPIINKRNSSNSILPEPASNYNIFKIIFLFLFNKCKAENDKIIVLSFLDYISDKIKEEKHKEQYYDILIQLFFLFNNEQIKQNVINLFSKTFIKDIENENSYDFIEELFGISHTNNFYIFGSNKMRIIKHFLINISTYFKEISNTNLKVKIIIKLSDVLNKYIKNYNKISTESPSPELYSSDNMKNKLKKEEIINLFHNLELDNINWNDNYNNYFNFVNYVKFYITFFHFLEYNFSCEEVFNDLTIRKKVFNVIINFITKLEILSIQGEKSYVNDIIKLVKLFIKIIEKNSVDCFEDFQMLCSFFGDSLQKISNVSNNHKIIDFHFLRLIYSIIIFFLIQLKKIFRLPNSIIKIHKDIIECIKIINNEISKFLNEFKIELYSNSKLAKNIYQDLKNYLKSEKKLEVQLRIFRQIIDIIYSKIFGKTSSLYMFLESQNCQIINEEIKDNDNTEINDETKNPFNSINFQSNYLNEITLKFADEKDSNLSIKKIEEGSQELNLPKISDENKDILFNKKKISSLDLSDKLKI